MRRTFVFLLAGTAFVLGLVFSVRTDSSRATWVVGDSTVLSEESRPTIEVGFAAEADASGSCSCPQVSCTNGNVAQCSVTCDGDREPSCSCEGGCNSASGNPSGRNRCSCN